MDLKTVKCNHANILRKIARREESSDLKRLGDFAINWSMSDKISMR
jgi:hypothetical protein